MTTVSDGTLASSGATSGMRLSGTERITTSTSATACAAVTARPPKASTSASIVSGPRELATFTSWPAALSLRARIFPIWPVPTIPIFMSRISLLSLRLSGCRVGERFEHAPEVVQALIGQLAGGLDLVGDAADVGVEGAATGCQVDQHAAFVGGIARARDHAGGIEPLEQRRDRARVHVQPGTERADGQRCAVQQLEDHEILGEGQAQRLEERLVQPHHPVRRPIERKGELRADAVPF